MNKKGLSVVIVFRNKANQETRERAQLFTASFFLRYYESKNKIIKGIQCECREKTVLEERD